MLQTLELIIPKQQLLRVLTLMYLLIPLVFVSRNIWLSNLKGFTSLHELVEANPGDSNDVPNEAATNTFQGFPLRHVNETPASTVHCIGENFDKTEAYLYRSCHYRNLCYDMEKREFVAFRDKAAKLPEAWWSSTQLSAKDTTVVAGPQHKTWFPVIAQEKRNKKTRIGSYQVRNAKKAPSSYYQLDATWIPFHRHWRSHQNPGHLIWDDFLALFTLMGTFDRTHERILLTHVDRIQTKEFKEDPWPEEHDLVRKFLPLMGYHPYPLREKDLEFNVSSPKSSVVCATHGLIGNGLFSDHGAHHWHGQSKRDYDTPHNHGRGAQFLAFREYMMKNIGVDPSASHLKPYRILVSVNSSTRASRNIAMSPQVDALRTQLEDRAFIQEVELHKMNLTEQVELLSRTSVFISAVGGATSSAFFLPRDASVFLYRKGGIYLDWDVWNNFPQVRAHWLRIKDKDEDKQLAALVKLVSKELDYLDKYADG